MGPQAQALGAAAKAAGIDLATTDVGSAAAPRSQLTPPSAGGRQRVAALFGQSHAALDVALSYDGSSATIEAYETVPPNISGLVRSVIDAVHQREVLGAAGVPASRIDAAQRPVPLAQTTLKATPPDLAGRWISALAAAMLLMYAVAGYGSSVANGVAQEKTSRTAEVLLAAVKPRELMIGKVLGVGLVGLGQMIVTVGAALIANAVVKSQVVPPVLSTLLPMIVVWFVLGFTLYAFGFAAAGAMVARQEEVQSVTMPFTVFLVAGLLLVYATIAAPDAPWVSVAGMAWEAGRIYRRALVRGGARLSWSSALRLR